MLFPEYRQLVNNSPEGNVATMSVVTVFMPNFPIQMHV